MWQISPQAVASKALKNSDGKMFLKWLPLFSFFFIIKEVVVEKKRGGGGQGEIKSKRRGSFEATLPKSIYSITNPP